MTQLPDLPTARQALNEAWRVLRTEHAGTEQARVAQAWISLARELREGTMPVATGGVLFNPVDAIAAEVRREPVTDWSDWARQQVADMPQQPHVSEVSSHEPAADPYQERLDAARIGSEDFEQPHPKPCGAPDVLPCICPRSTEFSADRVFDYYRGQAEQGIEVALIHAAVNMRESIERNGAQIARLEGQPGVNQRPDFTEPDEEVAAPPTGSVPTPDDDACRPLPDGGWHCVPWKACARSDGCLLPDDDAPVESVTGILPNAHRCAGCSFTTASAERMDGHLRATGHQHENPDYWPLTERTVASTQVMTRSDGRLDETQNLLPYALRMTDRGIDGAEGVCRNSECGRPIVWSEGRWRHTLTGQSVCPDQRDEHGAETFHRFAYPA
jgi:hypothetical protein